MRQNTDQFIPRAGAGQGLPIDQPQQSVPRLGKEVAFPLVMTLALDDLAEQKRIPISGNFLWAIDATDIAVQIFVRFNSQSGGAIPVSSGFLFSGIVFDEIYADWIIQGNKSITLVYGMIPGLDFNVINPNAQANQIIVASGFLSKPSIIGTLDDVSLAAASATQILPQDLTRHEAIITNLATNTNTFRIGDNFVDPDRGTPLAPGGTMVLQGTEAIFGYNPGAGVEKVALTSVRD